MYFVTICTRDRECFFGDVVSTQCIAPLRDGKTSLSLTKKVQLNALGQCVENEWIKTPTLRPDMNLSLAEYVVMPNHFHGMINIGDNQFNLEALYDHFSREGDDNVSTQCIASIPTDNIYNTKNSFGPQRKNLSSIIRGFKASVTTFARKENIQFDWQPRFYDHIITSREEYFRIINYTKLNPTNWTEDEFYKSN